MIIIVGRVLFYFDDLATVGQFYRTLFGGAAGSIDFVAETAVLNNFWLWVIGIVCCLPLIDWSKAKFSRKGPSLTTQSSPRASLSSPSACSS